MKSAAIMLLAILALSSKAEDSLFSLEDYLSDLRSSKIEKVEKYGQSYYAGAPHDAYVYFIEHGSKEAAFLLIEHMKYAQIVQLEAITKEEGMECTWFHAKDALEAQTGLNFGMDYQKWKEWWKEDGIDLPEKFFDPALHKKEEENNKGTFEP